MDRDHNAAVNILNLGLVQKRVEDSNNVGVGVDSPEFTSVETVTAGSAAMQPRQVKSKKQKPIDSQSSNCTN